MKLKRKCRPWDDTLDEDVCTEILLRLPVKSVTKCKLVCKRWLSLISADYFRRLHTLRRHKPQPSLFLQIYDYRNCKSSFFHFNDPIKSTPMIPFTINIPNNPKISIVSSCNGLLLLKSPPSDYHIYNPTTKQWRKLNLMTQSHDLIIGLNLAFHPSQSPHYKVICVRSHRIEVYESESRAWKVRSEEAAPPSIDCLSGVHCNNCIYWLSKYRGSYGHGEIGFFNGDIYYFDIDKHSIRSIRRPQLPEKTPQRLSIRFYNLLRESNGRLCYIALYQYSDEYKIGAWELIGDEWVSTYLYTRDRWRRRCSGEWEDLVVGRWLNVVGEKMSASLLSDCGGEIGVYSFMHDTYSNLLDFTTAAAAATTTTLYPSSISDYSHVRLQISVYQFDATLALL